MPYKWASIAVVVSLAVAYVSHLHSQLSESDLKLAQQLIVVERLESDKHTLQANNDKLSSSLDKMNDAITQAALVSKQANKTFEDFSKQMNKRFIDISNKADKVFDEKKPETCVDAINYLVDAVPEYVK